MKIDLQITRQSDIVETPRVKQLLGIFDVPPSKQSTQSWTHKFTLPDEWNVGVIVGPSGAGKSTLAREAFGDKIIERWDWPAEKSIVDGFPEMGIRDIAGLLSSVGFSSPPSWLRPFNALSNGEQFRVNVARTLAEHPDLAVVDEFTSVVDRQVAQIGSAAIAKAVRRRGQKFVAVTCHYDVLDWLEPDWIYEPHTGKFEATDAAGRSLRRRPPINLEIVRVDRAAWKLFKQHHYLTGDLHKSSKCFIGLVDGTPAAFAAVLPFPHPKAPGWRGHRTVCLPDFQGVGIGNALSEFVASLFSASKRYTTNTSHPSMIRHRTESKNWKMIRRFGFVAHTKTDHKLKKTASSSRLTASFAYIGQPRPIEAKGFGLPVAERYRKSPSVPSLEMARSE